jgi:SSS family solute:Na+ symporter
MIKDARMNVYLIALLLYSIFLMALGFGMRRRVKSTADFLVAGRSLGPGRLFATFLAAIGTFLLSQFLGPKLWRIAKEHGLSTLQDFLELRYGKTVKAVIAVLFWLGALAILAGQLIAIAWILNTVAGIPKWQGCVIGGAVAIVYCVAGGLMASSFVNMFELAVTMSGLLLAVPFALHAVGGWEHLHEMVLAHAGNEERTAAIFSMTGAGAKQIVAWLAILVPSFMVSPGLVQKVYGARDASSVRRGVGLNTLGQVVFAFVPPVLGLCAFAALPHLANPELALPETMKALLPEWLGVWTLASIFSAELSATDAILFMLSTSLAVDLYKTFLNPEVSQEKLLRVSRGVLVGAGIAGIVLAALLPSIIAAVSIFYGLIAVALFVPVLAGLYLRRIVSVAALSSIFAALISTLIAMRHVGSLGVLSPPAIGILTAAVVMVLFRVFAPALPERAQEEVLEKKML